MALSHLSDARHRIARADELEAEIELLKDRRASLEQYASAVPHDREEALWQRHDDLGDEIGRLRRELDELQDMSAMSENARDRAWHQGRTI